MWVVMGLACLSCVTNVWCISSGG